MHERLKEIRLEKKLNQADFSKLLGMGQSTLGMMEVGKREILDRHIKTVCSICNVNEDWLRTGRGNMFIESQQTLLDELVKEHNLDDLDKNIIESYLKLNGNQKSAIKTYLLNLCSNLSINNDQSAAQEIDQEVEAYRQELEAERKGAIFSASEDIKRAK